MHRFLNGRGGEQKSRWLQEGKVENFEEKQVKRPRGIENRKNRKRQTFGQIFCYSRGKKKLSTKIHTVTELSLSMCDQIALSHCRHASVNKICALSHLSTTPCLYLLVLRIDTRQTVFTLVERRNCLLLHLGLTDLHGDMGGNVVSQPKPKPEYTIVWVISSNFDYKSRTNPPFSFSFCLFPSLLLLAFTHTHTHTHTHTYIHVFSPPEVDACVFHSRKLSFGDEY